MPDAKGSDGSGGVGRFLCSAERLGRKALPFLDALPEHNADLSGGDRSFVGYGPSFCGTPAPPPTPVPKAPKAVLKFLLHGRGGGVARFSDATGELEVFGRWGKLLW